VNGVDLVLVLLLTLCGVRGFVRGLFREATGLIGLVAGGAAAAAHAERGAAILHEMLPLGPLAEPLVAGIVIFTAANAVVHVLAAVLDRVARAAFLGGPVRLAGALLGMGKGAAVLGFVLLGARIYAPSPAVAEAIAASKLGRPLVDMAVALLRVGGGVTGAEEEEA
jgi:membrane protein required for colicin V production